MPEWVVTTPGPGELTVASIDLTAASGQSGQVVRWAQSVAERRVLPSIAPENDGERRSRAGTQNR